MIKLTFIVPPALDEAKAAERTAGCTRVVYPVPNIYELTAVALAETIDGVSVDYQDFAYPKRTEEDFVHFLENDDSCLYAMWMVNLSIDNDVTVCHLIHQIRPEARILMLGPGSTYFSDKCCQDSRDIVLRGEPEETLEEILTCLRDEKDWTHIRGISYRLDGKLVHNPTRRLIKDLDRLPFPARHFLKGKSFHNPKLKKGPYTTMVTSRNCPFHCIYCVPSSLSFAREIEYRRENDNKKPTVAFRSVENVEQEIRELSSQGYRSIGFMDDNFIWNEQRTSAICAILSRYNISWGCQARVDAITESIAKLLGESHCLYVDLGVESFNDDILKYVKKGITREQIYQAVALLKKYRVPVKLNILIGCSPLETPETVKETLREVKRLDVDQVMFNIVSPFPGTEYYEICKENGWLADGEYKPTDVQRSSNLNLPHLSAHEMERLLYRNNISYYLRLSYAIKQIRRFSSFKEFYAALKALKEKLFG